MNTSSSFVFADAARGRHLTITIALAAIAAAAVLAITLHHRPSHAIEVGAQAMSSASVEPGPASFVDVSLPAASEVLARGVDAADEPCLTF